MHVRIAYLHAVKHIVFARSLNTHWTHACTQAEKAAKEAREAQANSAPASQAPIAGKSTGRSASPSIKLAAAEGGIVIDDVPKGKQERKKAS
jgi:hypothetical protein